MFKLLIGVSAGRFVRDLWLTCSVCEAAALEEGSLWGLCLGATFPGATSRPSVTPFFWASEAGADNVSSSAWADARADSVFFCTLSTSIASADAVFSCDAGAIPPEHAVAARMLRIAMLKLVRGPCGRLCGQRRMACWVCVAASLEEGPLWATCLGATSSIRFTCGITSIRGRVWGSARRATCLGATSLRNFTAWAWPPLALQRFSGRNINSAFVKS